MPNGPNIVETPSESATGPPKVPRVKPPKNHGLGMTAYADTTIAPFLAQPIDKRGRSAREKWSEVAYILALRAKAASQSYGKKDFNSLYRLILSAGIAFDKAWPPSSGQSLGGSIVVQLFGSLGHQVRQIVEPSVPTLEAKAEVVDPKGDDVEETT